jgi:hypothetical protein
MNKSPALADWTPEQIALGKRWVETWRLGGEDLERIRRKEIRELDTYKSIALLCGSAVQSTSIRANLLVRPHRTTTVVQKGSWT